LQYPLPERRHLTAECAGRLRLIAGPRALIVISTWLDVSSGVFTRGRGLTPLVEKLLADSAFSEVAIRQNPELAVSLMQSPYLFFEGRITQRGSAARRPKPRVEIPADPETAEDAGSFLNTLFGIANLPVKSYRGRALARRLPACLRFLRADNPEHASLKIWENPELATAALNVVLLGVTEFFRDATVFDHLGEHVLPTILRETGRPRIWSAACSEGHELYSVAMQLAAMDRLQMCELVGTDCRAEAIDQAARGLFECASLTPLAPCWRNYFAETRSSALIAPELRSGTTWKVADLLRATEPGPWHLILWRNMAIYLETSAADAVWKQLSDELAPGGFLVGGKADPPPKWLPLDRVGPCTYRKRDVYPIR
jgi:chemotaxis methyl-accepting protein methylase